MIGIEISSRVLRLVQWDGKAVRCCVEYPLPENIYSNSHIASFDKLAECLKQVLRENKLSRRECGIIIPSSDIMMRRLHLPYMTVQQLEMNLPYEFRDFLNEDKDAYAFDYAVNSIYDNENGAKTMDIMAVAVRKETLDNYRAMCRAAGMKMSVAVPVEAAFSNYIRKFGDSEREYCIMDLGSSKSRIYFYRGPIHEATRIIDYGINHIDTRVEVAAGANSEKIARENANTMHNTIAADVRKAINFYSFNNRGSEISEIFVCGYGAEYPELVDTISQTTGLEVFSIYDMLPSDFERREDLTVFIQAFSCVLQ